MPGNAKHDIDAKVVHLEPESHRFVRAQLARLPAPVHSVHEKGKFLVLGLIKSFFDRADDSLFELADKAQSNQEQNLYFDSMREVRVQRRGFEKHFSESIDQAFANLTSANPVVNDEDTGRNFNSDALSLVGNDELEEMVALDASIARANKELGEPIQLISLRLDSLVPIKVYQKNNPLSPDVICSAFMAETKKLDVGIKAKLVLFKLFDKSVVGRLGEVYGPINEIFKDNNILPSLSSSSERRRRRTDSADRRSAPQAREPNAADHTSEIAADSSNVSPEVISTLKALLGGKVAANPSAPSETQIAANELIQLLSRAQHMPSIMDSQVAINVRSLVSQLQQQSGAQAAIGQVDDQVMNLVNLLFDFILEDRNLAPPMKALISRMQIPIIKVAVADKAFFTKGGHVARRLLNEMATAAMGWQGDEESSKRDSLYRKIEAIVRTLIEEFDTDITIFSDLLADFSAFLEKEKKRAAVLERRTVDAEDGKAKAEVARTTVALEIEVRTVGYTLPKVVDHLIKDAWSNVLFVTVLKYGYDSEEWLSHLKVLEELVVSVQPPRTIEQRQRLIKLVPGLLKKLRSGLDTISYNPFEMSDLFKSLERVHIACIRGVPQATNKAAKPERSAPNTQHQQPRKKLTPKAKKPVADSSIEAEIPERSLNDLAKGVKLSEIDSVDRMLTGAQTAKSKAKPKQPRKSMPKAPQAPTSLSLDDPHMIQVRAFVQGAWFDMTDVKGESTRCRLAAFIKPTGKYIFVNRNGMKVAEKTQFELAMALKSNQLSALDNSVLFDRALETIVSSLRKN